MENLKKLDYLKDNAGFSLVVGFAIERSLNILFYLAFNFLADPPFLSPFEKLDIEGICHS